MMAESEQITADVVCYSEDGKTGKVIQRNNMAGNVSKSPFACPLELF
jgi:hypothetical protein